jgi:hypothetical protein
MLRIGENQEQGDMASETVPGGWRRRKVASEHVKDYQKRKGDLLARKHTNSADKTQSHPKI